MEAREVRSAQSERPEVEQTVRDVMRGRPKTLPSTASVADLRRFFADTHVMIALVVDERGLVGVIERAELADSGLPDGAPIEGLVRRQFDAIDVRSPASDVWKHGDLNRTGRLVVLEPDGKTLAGLVCVRPNDGGFCR